MTYEQRKRMIQSLDERIPQTPKDSFDRARLCSIRLWLDVGLTPSDIHKLHRAWRTAAAAAGTASRAGLMGNGGEAP
jgi:hypothetical protein